MYPGLPHGAYECLHAHGTKELQQTYLPKLDERRMDRHDVPDRAACGSDLGVLRTKAEPQADGSYSITGNKIFISGGEHDLARTSFTWCWRGCPMRHRAARASRCSLCRSCSQRRRQWRRNAIRCGGIEEEDGHPGQRDVRRSSFDGAAGWLVGEPQRGLAAMFVMMNSARLCGHAGARPTEMAAQNALTYAKDRMQMRPPRDRAPGQGGRPDHRASGHAQDAADRTCLRRGWTRVVAVDGAE